MEGFHKPVSYGRLREACQTDVDGTSIDTIEVVANQLGLRADQEMLPVDHLFLKDLEVWPALLVVRHADGPTHFVVVWRRIGNWLQVMDPAIGRRWVNVRTFCNEIFRHETAVPAEDWRDWAGSAEFRHALYLRILEARIDSKSAKKCIEQALADHSWFSIACLDASTRLLKLIADSKGVRTAHEAAILLTALLASTSGNRADPFALVPADYWSVYPDPAGDEGELLMRGAVLMRVRGLAGENGSVQGEDASETPELSPELAAALSETAVSPMRVVYGMLKTDGILSPLVLTGAIAIAAGAAVVEALLFRGIFDISALLNLPSQRLFAALGLIAFVAVLMAIRLPISSEALRLGRRFDTLLRMALLRKLPHLTDRYFQSRPISDMADRSHSIHLTRNVPMLGIRFVQTFFELILTLVGILIVAPGSFVPAILLAAFAIVVPFVMQPAINERDLRVRNHAATMNGFYLDTLLGLVPVRTHRAERAVGHQHEAILVEWARSSRRLARASVFADAVQSSGTIGLAAFLLVSHFISAGGVAGGDLLLIFWTLKLPATGSSLTGLAQQYPLQRNILLRLIEPLSAPEELPRKSGQAGALAAASTAAKRVDGPDGVGIDIRDGLVLAAGHSVLQDINLHIEPGEHIAIVGLSGAGKSSLIGMLLGWHRLAEGDISVDGEALSSERLGDLRQKTAWLDPAVQVWNKSLIYNLTYSSADADFGRTAEAIEQADLRGILQKLPEGLQTQLGEGGALLSGGEGQKVRLARTLVQGGVRLALLDEPFRGMDRGQRVAMLAQARERWRDITLLCVTHDVSETVGFPRVLVIEDGRIIEDGVPSDLAQSSSRYRDLLETERMVQTQMWAGKQWRHLEVRDGGVTVRPA